MSLTASAHSIPGSLRQEVTVDGRFHLATDEPERLGGSDTAPAPHELVPAALASCVSTTLLMYAGTKGWDLGRVDVDVDYDHRATPPRCTVSVRVERPLSELQAARLEKVVAACPVRRALEGCFVFDERLTAGVAEPAPVGSG